MSELDRIDCRILDFLQRQGRMSVTELGEQVGLSTSPCSDRVKRLERLGYISGYHAHVNATRLGRSLLVFIEITLSQKSPQIFESVRREVGQMPEVLECHLVSGSFDYLLKARLRVMTEYRELLGKILDKIPVPAQSNSYVVMEEIKESTVLPMDR
jgi:Lrp/AsnC family transcriptional regulator, leucine-responsive regulatory protein